MSYCNFWYRPMKLEDDVYQAIEQDAKKIKAHFNRIRIQLEPASAQGGVESEEGIYVSGPCETFIFPKTLPEDFKNYFLCMKDGRMFQFVKTNKGAYDGAIQAILIIAKHHLKERILVTSDGEIYQWERTMELVHSLLGYGEDFELDESPTAEEMGMKFTWVVAEDK